MPELIVSEHFDNAVKLLEKLHPLNSRWGATPGAWIFRGHWDSEWPLLPSICREVSVQPFTYETWEGLVAQDSVLRHQDERSILLKAWQVFDEAGLAIPYALEVKQMLLDNQMLTFDGSWLEPIVVPFLALAQHHGVPTRLLDWSTRGPIAAYFAVSELLRRPAPSLEGNVEIIALRAMSFDIPVAGGDVCKLVRAPRSSNANLHAQAGLFTHCPGLFPTTPLDDLIKAALEPHGDTIMKPVMQRMTLPKRLASELLATLAYEHVTGATVFPGYTGAVLRMKENIIASHRLSHFRR